MQLRAGLAVYAVGEPQAPWFIRFPEYKLRLTRITQQDMTARRDRKRIPYGVPIYFAMNETNELATFFPTPDATYEVVP